MSSKSLAIYAERARLIDDDTVASGRRPLDRSFNSAIARSILDRLDLTAADRLLDIGSGIGMMTVPMSYFVTGVTAVDHADVLARMPERSNIEKVPGDFLTVDMGERTYTKALAYSMVHYLRSQEEVIQLVDKALLLLADGGLLLLGDVPNDSYRDRNMNTERGQRAALSLGVGMVAAENERVRMESVLTLPPDRDLPVFMERDILNLIAHVRVAGHHANILRQPASLPFHLAREDILIQKCVKAPMRDLFVVKQRGQIGVRHLGLSLREVQEGDCDMLYWWHQDPAVKAGSIRTEEFTLAQHREWFARTMDERITGDVRWYILENVDLQPLGVVRFGRVRKGRAVWSGGPVAESDGGSEISILIAAPARGQGLATAALEKAMEYARKVLPGPFIALIKPDNLRSIKTFERLDFKRVGDEVRLGVQLGRWERA